MPAVWKNAVLAATAVLAVACATTAPQSPEPESPSEKALANRIYLALNADPIYFFRHVDVNVVDGVVDLSGYVWSTDAIYRARQIATGVPGVKGVVTNNLELERQGRTNGVSR
ncbi:MAG: BON domain-containing protein [Steroidobacteraceae bacterium]|jgi:osmotically-inducible protein OsmY